MSANPQLYCPIRGLLKAKLKAKDGFTFTEEKRRIDCLHLLIEAGYPKSRIEAETIVMKFGHKGKNSLRADIVVYDRPISAIKSLSEDKRRASMKIIGEIKRENSDSETAKEDQLKPALSIASSPEAIGVYWDDVEQTILYKNHGQDGSFTIEEASIASLPKFGSDLTVIDLKFGDLKPATDLVRRFSKIDDALHQAGHGTDSRYSILFQVLLVKILDEQRSKPIDGKMLLQDFSLRKLSEQDVVDIFESGLETALKLYGPQLPKKPSKKIAASGETLRQISRILCPIDILGSSPQVIQDFFMYFGRFLYKVDLAQYFTPYEVIELIVRIVNPRFGDVVKDPACGTADFLVGAMRVAEERHGVEISAQLHGVDTGDMAVNLSVFNMILNGDGSSKIRLADSLKEVAKEDSQYTVALCNPPFGTNILEKRADVLRQFDLGRIDDDPKAMPLKAQETGILFVEVCLRNIEPGGRIGIILPNGYLGNRGQKYLRLRAWMLKRARVAAVIGFPRFTFKRSGADVSASVVILEKREQPLKNLEDADAHPIHFNLIEKVGWNLQSKRAERKYRRDISDGSLLLDTVSNEPVLDADFGRVLNDLYSSGVVDAFEWMTPGVHEASNTGSWSVSSKQIEAGEDLCLDPKQWCEKHHRLRESIENIPHFKVGAVLEPVSRRLRRQSDETYRYIEIEKIYESFGAYIPQNFYGWSMPDRGKHVAAPGDIFVASIWSSAGKWMIAGDEAEDGKLIVTSGCSHFQVKEGCEDLLPHLLYGMSLEAFRVQLRAKSRGSDGLSSVTPDDILDVILPKITGEEELKFFEARLKASKSGALVLTSIATAALKATSPGAAIEPRSSHVVQV